MVYYSSSKETTTFQTNLKTDWGNVKMAKGFQAVEELTAKKVASKRTYLKAKEGQSIKVRIPENITDQLTTVMTYSVYQVINTTLAYHLEKPSVRDLYHEARQIMLAEHNEARGKVFEVGSQDDKDSWKAANQLEAKPVFLFGVFPLADFVQGGTTKNTYPAGEPILLETNQGAKNANIKALQDILTDEKFIRKAAGKAYEIKALGANKYSFTPLDEEDLTADELAVFKATEGKLLVDEDFEGAIFESDETKQLTELKELGFDVSKLSNVSTPVEAEPAAAKVDDMEF